MCGGSPLICFVVVLMIAVFEFDVGEIHRRGDVRFYSRSPLSVFIICFTVLECYYMSGRFTGEEM